MKRILFIAVFFCAGKAAFAQETLFPKPVIPGDTFEVSAQGDTLWVLKHSQYMRALSIAQKFAVTDSMLMLQEMKIQKLNAVIAEKDSIIELNKAGFERYRGLWEESDKKLEKTRIKLVKARRMTLIAALGSGALGAVLVAILK